MNSFEIIHFQIAGLNLQEPNALIINWIISFFCLFVFFKLNWASSFSSRCFNRFYLFFGISTFLGGVGHLFFKYTGVYGKFPSWIFGVFASFYIAKGIIFYLKKDIYYKFWNIFLYIKSITLLLLSILTKKFIFIAFDAILTYVIYSGYISWKLSRKEKKEMQYFVFGMLVLLPSAFVFLMNINLHKFLNRDDLSHILMFACIIFFYFGIKISNQNYLLQSKKIKA